MTVLTRRLQLGAFDQATHGWVNTDITPHLFVARIPGLGWAFHRLGVIGPERYAAHRAGVFCGVCAISTFPGVFGSLTAPTSAFTPRTCLRIWIPRWPSDVYMRFTAFLCREGSCGLPFRTSTG
jgi:hypothetical protein